MNFKKESSQILTNFSLILEWFKNYALVSQAMSHVRTGTMLTTELYKSATGYPETQSELRSTYEGERQVSEKGLKKDTQTA
jgi:hypothetical protein